MIRWKIITLTVAFSFLLIKGNAQFSATDSIFSGTDVHGNASLPLHKLKASVQAGTEFMSTSGYGSGLSTYISPSLTYPVTKRFLVSGGISIVNTSLFGYKPYYSFTGEKSFTGNITQAMLWVSGQYLLNDRLTITGTAYKSMDISGDKAGSTRFYKTNPQGAYLNLGYKISDYMHIEAGFGYSRGSNDYSFGYPGIRGFGSSDYRPFFNR